MLNQTYKKQLIDQYLLPALGDLGTSKAAIAGYLYAKCSYFNVRRHQDFGTTCSGNLLLAIEATVHAYRNFPTAPYKRGMRIWKAQEFVFCNTSSLNDKDGMDRIEALDNGTLLIIYYKDLLELMERFKEIKNILVQIIAANESYNRHRDELMQKPPNIRVKEFIRDNQLFVMEAGTVVAAMHVWLSRQTFWIHESRMEDQDN